MKQAILLLFLAAAGSAFASEVAIDVEGVCFSRKEGVEYKKSVGIDFDVVTIMYSKKEIAKVYVGNNPSVGKFRRYTFSEYRMKQNGPTIIDMGKEGILGVTNKYYQAHFHIFGGTASNMKRAQELVSFCD